MSYSPFINLYLRDQKSEQEIISKLELITGLKIDSLNFPNKNNVLHISYIEFTQGFKTEISIYWPTNLNNIINGYYIAQELSCALNVLILFDASLLDCNAVSFDGDDIWFLANNRNLKQVNVKILDDGIDILS
ncbi:hypothetical protein [Gilliamella sp. WF3-4]|uniref:hypothetical protein n=1 Tax=Gilliamella sp. WF3-4 TaxID=3120255 RepID=UPI00080DEA94|nr:hypothetical protein [Gilliamella apicola]OCG15362.1 hypothetical protein A9G47_12375 [Gilliamella apicola]